VTAAALLSGVAVAAAQSTPTRFMPGAVSAERNDYNLSITDDGRTLVFARSEADFAKARILVSERGRMPGARWSPPQPISSLDGRYRDSDPWLTPDGRTLYFVSDRPTAARPEKRDMDVWRSVKSRGRWGAPEHLGDLVNRRGEELGPEVHDGRLYFASALRSGLGGLDVYVAEPTPGGFGAPRLLPAPINSAASESDFTLSRDGRTALFWRMVGERGLLHVSRRGVDGRWSEPEALPDSVNIGPFNFTPAFSANGAGVTFASTAARSGQAAGLADIFEASIQDLHEGLQKR
jgi:hypothetical protein